MSYELPEIAVLAQQLNQVLPGRHITDIDISDKAAKLIEWGFINLMEHDIQYLKIDTVTANGLWLLIHFENGMNLVFGHLIGKLLYYSSEADIQSGYKVRFTFNDFTCLALHASLYGFAYAIHDNDIPSHKYIGARGITPLDKGFTFDYFSGILKRNQKHQVKKLQSFYDEIAGFQNGYFQDILYCAGVLPAKKISELNRDEYKKIHDCMISVTAEALDKGGNTEDVDIYNTPGSYKRKMGKHLKGKPCPKCGAIVQAKNLLGSVSHFCPGCQK
jgi:formamidopyrimidine-DNA glycosylase